MYKSWNRGYMIAHLVNLFVRTPRINPDNQVLSGLSTILPVRHLG